MTYLGFLLLFVLVPIAVLLRRTRGYRPDGAGIPFSRALAFIAIVAFAYTTPWDNYLVAERIWTYGADRVLGTLFYVPYEEYAFFLLQPVLTGLWMRALLSRDLDAGQQPARNAVRVVGIVAGLSAAAGAGILLSGWEKGTYLGLIIAWACPVIAALAFFSGPALAARWRTVVWTIAVPTLYLWIADRFAIGDGIWHIEDATSLDIDPLGLPIEEAVFFLVTNVLVAFGLVTFLFGTGRVPRRDQTS